MKAWELQDRGFDNLKLVERPTPQPGPHDLLVRVSAVSLNHRDEDIILGDYFPQQPQLSQTPLIIVSDAAGIVAEAGVEVSRFKEGDRVTTHLFSRWIDGEPGPHEEKYSLGGPLPGGLAEYMVVHEDAAVATPTSLSDAEASTLPIAALTAWFSLVDLGELQAEHTVLTQGSGVVSIFAVQLAAALGARVISTSGSDDKLKRLQSLGATDVINYKTNPDWQEVAKELTDGDGVNQVLDVSGDLRRSVEAARVGGHVAVIGYLASAKAEVDLWAVLARRTRIDGVAVGPRRAFEEMNRFIEGKSIKPLVDARYPFGDALSAFKRRGAGAFGKIIIDVNS